MCVCVCVQGFLCKLGDVGLARLVPASSRSMTSGAGTVYYMAPEVSTCVWVYLCMSVGCAMA